MAKSSTVNRRVNLYINGKEVATDIRSVKAEMQKLVNEQVRMKIGSDEYVAHAKRIRDLKAIIQQHNTQLQVTKKNWLSLGNLSDSFNKYFGIITAGLASITGLILGFRKLSENVAKMDDVYADVEKTTNLTKKEVKELNEEFKKMDTRTSREELNKLAADAGKLGISGKKDILDFVDAGNQINVALGEDLGEDAIKNIGKISQVYKISTKELESLDLKEQMLSVGSAINELGQSSTASESYLVDFAHRLGGVASQAGISIQNILGFGSALDQSGQKVEMSATALQNFIMKLMSDPAKFAQLAGQDVKKFTDLLKTDTNAAIIQVLTSLNSKGGFQALIPIFNEMGLDGARAVGVLSALATNINVVTEAQNVSNRGFTEAISITNEYDKKNTNLQAQLKKAQKKFNDQALILGEKLNPMLLKSTNGFTYLVKALVKAPEFIKENSTLLLSLATALGSYIAFSSAAAIQTGVLSSKTSILNGIKKAYNILTLESVMNKEREKISTQTYVQQLEQCITKEQAATLQKKGLAKDSVEYVKQLENAAERNVKSTQDQIDILRKEVPALHASTEAKRKAYISSANLVEQRRLDAYWANQSGNATQIATAQKRLENAVNKQNAASTAYVSSMREFHTKKIQLETLAKQSNTLSTKFNTASEVANTTAKQVLFSVTTKLTTAMKALWVSMKTNPVGWITIAIGLFITFADKLKNTNNTLSRFNSVSSESFRNISKHIETNVSKIETLAAKYKELKAITNPTQEQQSALRDVIIQIAEITPSAITTIDKYNNALDINVDKTLAYTKKQQEVLTELSGKNASEWINSLYEDSKNILIIQEELSRGFKYSNFWGFAKEDRLSPSELLVTQKELDDLNIRRDLLLQLLSGTGIAQNELRGELASLFNTSNWAFMPEERTERKAALKFFDDYYAKLARLELLKEGSGGNPDGDFSNLIKEIAITTDKTKLQEYLLHQNQDVITAAQNRLNTLNQEIHTTKDLIELKEKELERAKQLPGRTEEEIALRNKKIVSIEKEIETLKKLGIDEDPNKLAKEKEKAEKDLAEKMQNIRAKLHIDSLSNDEREIEEASQKYEELLRICRKYNLDATEIYEAHEEEMSSIIDKEMLAGILATMDAEDQINLALSSSSDRQKMEIKKRYKDLLDLAQEYGIDTAALRARINEQMGEELEDVKPSGGAKLFNMSEEEWTELEEKLNRNIEMAGQLSNIWGQFNEIQNNRDKKEIQDYEKLTNRKKELLNKQLNSGRISQEKYNAQVAQLDADMEKKKTDIARKQAKRDKAQGIFSAIINTASAIVQALNGTWPASIIFAAIAAAMGAAQVAAIASTPLPEYAQGGMTDGARMYIAGEAGQEWIAPNNMINDPVTGPIIQQLELVRTGILSPDQLKPIIPDFATMTSIPMYSSGGSTGTNQSITNYYQNSTNDPKLLEVMQSVREEFKALNSYLSDPRNRQAIISNDLLKQNEKEMSILNHLKTF